jgi:hypothetical protein
VTLNLKIEILKVFSLEFSLSSDKELKLKKETQDEEKPDTADCASDSKPSKS